VSLYAQELKTPYQEIKGARLELLFSAETGGRPRFLKNFLG